MLRCCYHQRYNVIIIITYFSFLCPLPTLPEISCSLLKDSSITHSTILTPESHGQRSLGARVHGDAQSWTQLEYTAYNTHRAFRKTLKRIRIRTFLCFFTSSPLSVCGLESSCLGDTQSPSKCLLQLS